MPGNKPSNDHFIKQVQQLVKKHTYSESETLLTASDKVDDKGSN
jgi:hypothetical protein